MCAKGGRFQRVGACASDEWCIGKANVDDAIYDFDSSKAVLCSKGKLERA